MTTWITLMIAMFMFQGFWNVAAAFCVHETTAMSVQIQNHFGHHQTLLCQAEQKQNSEFESLDSAQLDSDQNQTIQDDHQDHLPSMAHLILPNVRYLSVPQLTSQTITPIYQWNNRYQTPDLLAKNPPPKFSPLMVG